MLCKVVGKSFMQFTDQKTGELVQKGTAHVIWEPDPEDDDMQGSRVQIITGLSVDVYESIKIGSDYEPKIKTKAVKDSYGNSIQKAIIYGFIPA